MAKLINELKEAVTEEIDKVSQSEGKKYKEELIDKAKNDLSEEVFKIGRSDEILNKNELINKLTESLTKEIDEINRNDKILNKNISEKAHMLCCNLNYHSKEYFKFLKDCNDPSMRIFRFLKNDAEKFKSN
ncbi:hypothetical protein NBO_595g0001 [Nosema bombycis CQ1]|uniref:Uncharacterized protein n=1 Tax=Nosema bombycis (strain CQ1 / CVCC 102059) TaxID=578461 RepID=R0MD60_NOSB1|nr:hypothetical protein NBO_595g0001 [Nosema bombycis CQ1]|eukprot:EOB12000.1 hypothetical protein NBO_595g0001 [Nosema bombycis CQ1]